LTLQGAVAHVDMPLESGPTLYLPHTQKWAHGYLVADRQDVTDYFVQHRVQLPLSKGDAVFFNPALIHAAGHNRSAHIHRMANLLQVSSAFGRAMESVNRQAMAQAVYPHLRVLLETGALDLAAAHRAIDATAEGYAFPTNLDRDPPLGGLAPASPQTVVREALQEGWTPTQLNERLTQLAWQRQT
jgi:ectoine hydroxylase-related dioxygenase (phytanoyl-CoA dioxygenase family)